MELDPVIQDRIQILINLDISTKGLASDQSQREVQETIDKFSQFSHSILLDAAESSKAEMTLWLNDLDIEGTSEVLVIWPHYRAGIELTFRDFVLTFDELWYPGADDIWILPKDRKWLLEFSHEEILSFRTFAPASLPSSSH